MQDHAVCRTHHKSVSKTCVICVIGRNTYTTFHAFISVSLPHAWVNQLEHAFYFRTKSFNLFYLVYSEAVINVFIMSSTWLTVTMSVSR